MPNIADFPITERWPAKHPDRLQLYSFPTPNGVKVSIMLEETGLPYEAHTVKIGSNESHTPEFLSLNPNGKIPGDRRPRRAGRRAARLVRVRRHPALSRRKDGQAAAGRARRPLRDHAVGSSSRWAASARCSASSASSTSSPERTSPTSGRWSATSTRRGASCASSTNGCRAANGSWANSTRSPTSPSSPGCATVKVFYEAGDLVGMPELTELDRWLDGLPGPPGQPEGPATSRRANSPADQLPALNSLARALSSRERSLASAATGMTIRFRKASASGRSETFDFLSMDRVESSALLSHSVAA